MFSEVCCSREIVELFQVSGFGADYGGDFDCVDVRGLVSPVFLIWFLTMGSL